MNRLLIQILATRVLSSAMALGTVIFGMASPAAAIPVTNVQVPYYEGLTLTGGILGAGSEHVGIAGQILLTTDIGILGTWCVDLFHNIYLGSSYTYTPGPLLTDNTGSSPWSSNPLSATQIRQIGSLAAYGNALMRTSPTNWDSAAVQAAIWDVEYGTSATGSTAFNASLHNIVTNILPYLPEEDAVQLSNVDGHNQILSQAQVTTDPIPEPASLLLLGTGLLGLGILRRHSRRSGEGKEGQGLCPDAS